MEEMFNDASFNNIASKTLQTLIVSALQKPGMTK